MKAEVRKIESMLYDLNIRFKLWIGRKTESGKVELCFSIYVCVIRINFLMYGFVFVGIVCLG